MLNDSEVELYFRVVEAGPMAASLQHAVHLLSRGGAVELTRKFHGHPVIDQLEGLVLDDPNTSNHHVLLRCPAVAGQILYLAHDDDSRVVFLSLQAFLTSAKRAQAQNAALPKFHPPVAPLSPNQVELAAFIRTLLAKELIDAALTLVPSLDLVDKGLLIDLVAHDDFFLGEAVAEAILARPSRELIPIATLCAQHSHAQVAHAGQLARQACAQ